MKILYITDYLPYPLISGDRIRVYNLIRRLAEKHDVALAGFLQTPDEIKSVSHLQEFCFQVETVNLPQRNKLSRLPNILRYVLEGIPFDIEFLQSKALEKKIVNMFGATVFDIVQLEHSRMALYLETLPANTHSKHVLTFHNVASNQYDRISNIALTPARRVRTWLHSRMLRRWEPRYAERFDRCITVSEVDRRLLLNANPRLKIDIIPNGVDTQIYQPLVNSQTRPSLILIGTMSYEPCADGAFWFCNEILPLIRRVVSDIQVWIVGNSPPPKVSKLNGNGVHVTGRVEDVVPYYRQCSVSIVPIRAGGGTRLKILEAMALGRPVVSTTIGCEGLDVIDSEHILIADEPAQFAGKTIRLLTDPSLYSHISGKARQLVMEKYDWDVITGQLLDVYAEIIR